MAPKKLVFVLLVACGLPYVAAIRPGRGLLVGGHEQSGGESYTAVDSDVTGPVAQYTVPGTDVLVVDTTGGRVAAAGGVISNQIESNAKAGSTYDIVASTTRTKVTKNADSDLRTTLGGMDQQGYVQGATEAGNPADNWSATRAAAGNAVVTNHGGGQMQARGMTGDPRWATRNGAASAQAVMVPDSHWYNFNPTWWR
ncbi:hypothetical protein Rsub_05099 [Raphidocelis subcapitata]|uniref:Uncharacterized protein n=1 Tax=Raphidocelis subcapitata TaxID=307507 RepID=A0A2V0P4E9_9CHLO|nr:hypothetical protein Rsub_05099 [Raphidocelis subcapitata]|eukprot:GBF92730.1 hypothetical protein Rsub_05099 [Raphidocelis subcapitata]